jgi:hypothetical protein
MKVIYKTPIQELIRFEYENSKQERRIIDQIVLTPSEFKELHDWFYSYNMWWSVGSYVVNDAEVYVFGIKIIRG